MKREIAFDTETTGLDPKDGHRVVEIGCVELIGHIRTGKNYHVYINPQRDMPPEAERVHGLSIDFLKQHKTFDKIAREFVDFVGDAVLVAHNASFDMKFINHELKQAGFKPYEQDQSFDTLKLARKKYPGQPATLDALCRRFNIDLSVRTKHGALLDAELLSDVYLEMMGGRQSSFGLRASEKEAKRERYDATPVTFVSRTFCASADEEEAHAHFLATALKEPIWHKV